jgi:acyl-[acyl-carrier-protein] desaturase
VATFPLPDALESVAASLLERHLGRSREWFPHELVPWSAGRDFPDPLAGPDPAAQMGETAAEGVLSAGVSSALFVNLLTEDNLPGYYHAISLAFGDEGAMGEWSRRWAAEEQRHAIVIRDWITVTRRLDLVALERARMHQVTGGFRPGGRALSLSDGLVYLALQELATRISHWNTGQHLDGIGAAVMKRVAADENHHFLFYRDLASAALEVDPSETVLAIDRQVTEFQMPGTEILGFAGHAAAISAAGIYDYRVHYEQILCPVVLNHWRLESVEGLSPAAEVAREHVLARIERMRRVADRIDAQAGVGAGLVSGTGRVPAGSVPVSADSVQGDLVPGNSVPAPRS